MRAGCSQAMYVKGSILERSAVSAIDDPKARSKNNSEDVNNLVVD